MDYPWFELCGVGITPGVPEKQLTLGARALGLAQPQGAQIGVGPTASDMVGPSRKIESGIRADTPVVFGRGSVPDAQVQLAPISQQPVKMTRADGAYVVANDEL